MPKTAHKVVVIGHRNPDTDSIVSAMAYAALRNALGDRNYVAAHMDHISDQTQRMLDRFGFQPPRTVQNVRTQVEDLDYDTPPALNATVTMDRAWHIMREQKISAIPVINEDGTRIFRVKNGKNEFVETTRPLVVVTAPGPGSGKLATLSLIHI